MGGAMIDRQKVETILCRRFPRATWEQVAVAANAIMGLEDEWQEIEHNQLPSSIEITAELRVFRRTAAEAMVHAVDPPADDRSLTEFAPKGARTVFIYYSDDSR
jgi:hypothetical protein